ncbi:hypothetical protein Q8F55_005652 [Vanrija albida]|uniref:Protein kinase domain-containing protein n=1 Tax=Vanrija albida TaxID=181172 RepID=A0ABR3Q2F3_9TREE
MASNDAESSSQLPSKRALGSDDAGSSNDASSSRTAEIKRRLVRAKRFRRPEDSLLDEEPAKDADAGGTEPEAAGTDKAAAAQPPDPVPSPQPRKSPSPRPPSPARGFPRSAYAPPRDKHPPLVSCRSVYNYTRLNHIEEGTYGVVFRARCNDTNDIYALKKLKLDEERHGFPITSLREIMALMTAGDHENVVGIREVVVGDTLNQIFIAMPFIEHDLKTLLADMPHAFLQSEVKTIMRQLLSAVAHCHSNWILHRDLKTSNLLMNNRGQIKVADFGLARKFGDPLGEMTQLVVTLWYRAPELLLGAKEYTTAIDMWSVGCIFAELMQKDPLFPGRGEIDQLSKIFNLLGKPNDDVWPGYSKLPNAKSINPVGPTFSTLRQKFKHLSSEGHYLMTALLCYDPDRRISAAEGYDHPYFGEQPLPKHPDLFPSFPSVASGERRHRLLASPPAPAAHVEKGDDDKMDLESFV